MFLRECWYVAGWSRDVGNALKPVRILGDDIVLFRKADGSVGALEDACPHRKLPLSKGRRDGDRIVCGYHGMTFDAGGACVATPTQERIPSGARVRAYPTLERYGFVWVWTGALESADPARLIDIPHYDDPAWGRTAGGDMAIACNYLYVTDNLLDPSHVAWVHISSFAGARTDSTPLRTDVSETGVVVWRWMMDTEPPAYYKPLVRFAGNADRKQHYECVVPSIAINKSIFAPAGHGGPGVAEHPLTYVNISYNFITPLDETTSHYYWFQHRNTDPDNQDISESMNRGAYGAFTEDKDVLEAVQIGMANRKTPHFDLALDAGALRFRKLVATRIAAEGAAATPAAAAARA